MTNYQTKQKPFHNHFSLSLLLIISLKICNIGKYEYQFNLYKIYKPLLGLSMSSAALGLVYLLFPLYYYWSGF